MRASEAAERYRRARLEVLDLGAARDELGAAVLERVRGVLRSFPALGWAQMDDLANQAAFAVLRAIEAGYVRPGSEDAYAGQAARHVAISALRARRPEDELSHDREVSGATAFPRFEEQLDAQRLLELVRTILTEEPPRIPTHFRELLVRVHVRNEPIENLAREELSRRRNEGLGDEQHGAVERARNSVDRNLTRARQALRAEVARRLGTRPGEREP